MVYDKNYFNKILSIDDDIIRKREIHNMLFDKNIKLKFCGEKDCDPRYSYLKIINQNGHEFEIKNSVLNNLENIKTQ